MISIFMVYGVVLNKIKEKSVGCDKDSDRHFTKHSQIKRIYKRKKPKMWDNKLKDIGTDKYEVCHGNQMASSF